MTGSVFDVQVVVHSDGGPEQVARRATYTSAIHDLGDGVTSLGALRYAARLAPAGVATVRARACDSETVCAGPWSAPIASGTSSGLGAVRFVQYHVELTGDGERESELDWIELDYRVIAAN